MGGNAINVLNDINGTIQLASIVEGNVVPIIVGAVTGIKALINARGEIEFTVAVAQGEADLQSSVDSFTAALKTINEERAKAGLDPLPVPGQ